MILQGRRILLALSGGIAAYKIPLLVRLLRQEGAEVRVALTPAAEEFVSPLTLAALSGTPTEQHLVLSHGGRTSWNNHVHLAEWAEAVVVAPATSNTLAKAANGLCDNLVLSIVLSAKCPVFWAPAMDLDMFAYPATQENLVRLRSMGHKVWPSPEGSLASGLSGAGRMVEPEFMLRALELHFAARPFWLGKTLLLTSGPTEESIDPVRFVTNGSSGRMGDAHVVIAAAAVSDLCPTSVRSEKIPKSELSATINFEPTPDILQDLAKRRIPGQVIIGFALETGEGLSSAKNKLARKGADAMVLNYETEQTGMNSSTNQITLVTEGREEQGPLETKAQVASRILDWVERFATKD